MSAKLEEAIDIATERIINSLRGHKEHILQEIRTILAREKKVDTLQLRDAVAIEGESSQKLIDTAKAIGLHTADRPHPLSKWIRWDDNTGKPGVFWTVSTSPGYLNILSHEEFMRRMLNTAAQMRETENQQRAVVPQKPEPPSRYQEFMDKGYTPGTRVAVSSQADLTGATGLKHGDVLIVHEVTRMGVNVATHGHLASGAFTGTVHGYFSNDPEKELLILK